MVWRRRRSRRDEDEDLDLERVSICREDEDPEECY